MRTTIRLDDDLLAKAKLTAASRRTTLTALIEDALRAALAEQPTGETRPPVSLTTVAGRGLQPGVDLDDSAALLDLMDQPDASV